MHWPTDLTFPEIKQVCSDLEASRAGNDYVNSIVNFYKKQLRIQIRKEALALKKLAEIKLLPATMVFKIFEFGGAANLLTGLMNAQLKRTDRIKSVPHPENNLYGVLQTLLARLFPEARKKMHPSYRDLLEINLPEEDELPSDIKVYVLLLDLNNPHCCFT
jgi:hypothetical protein